MQALRFDWHWPVTFVMAAGRDTPMGARSGVTFDVTLDILCNVRQAAGYGRGPCYTGPG